METTPRFEGIRGRRLWGVVAALATGGLLLMVYLLWSAYVDVWRDSRLRAASETDLLEARFEATLRRVDADLLYLSERVPRAAFDKQAVSTYRASVEHELERFRLAFPEVSGFRVIDRNGEVLYLSGGGEYVSIADRDYFREHLEGDAGLVFSGAIVSRITGRTVLAVSRAVRAGNGELLGVITGAIETAYFSRLLGKANLGRAGALTVGRRDTHSVVLRSPPLPSGQPGVAPEAVVAMLAAGETYGEVGIVVDHDGVRRYSVFRSLPDYPFFVMAGIAEDDVMGTWRQRALLVGGVWLMFVAGLGLVMAWLFRMQRRELHAAIELQRRQVLLNAAQRITQLGSWEFDLARRRVTCSEELLRIYELPMRPDGLRYADFAERFHPEDRARVDEVMQNARLVAGQSSVKHRLLMPDGRVKYVVERYETECAEDGTASRIIGTTQDLTDQHHLEARLQLLASAFEYSGEAIVITNRENRIVAVNPAFSRLTGYSASEALGQDPKILSAGRSTREDYRQMWAALNERGFWQGEIWDRRKDGGVYPKWLSISVIRDEDDSVSYYVAHFTDVTTERATQAKLHHMAHHDVLTGLLNRFSLNSRLDQALAAARRNGTQVALLFIDLDRFKVINDTLGHQVGDELLVEVARRLRSAVRDSDVVARLGGDEFVVMLTGVEQTSAVAMVAEKLVFNVVSPYTVGGHQLYTSPSIGIAMYPTDGENADTLLKNADAAMYHAKNAGRNNFQFFDPRMNDAAVERLGIEHALRQALKHEEFLLHFQPVIDIASGRVVSVEALVRWQHPEKGMLMPGAFIGIAEESGLIQPIGDWVFWAACLQLKAFRAAGIADVRMGINISPIQMRNSNLPTMVRGAVEAYDLRPADLVLEITESAAMERPEQTVGILESLHGMGVKLAIDDFGTGYSSLGYLRMFPIDHLKLDRSFVSEITRGDRSVICDATIGLAHNLGLGIIAEGVETPEQFDYLRERGCDMVQGYLYSKPIPAIQVIDFIRHRNG